VTWWSSAVNCVHLSFRATSRTPSRPRDSLPRLCVRSGVGCSMFSLVGRLPSMPSADGCPSLFGHFVGTTQPSDSPPTCIMDFGLMPFSIRRTGRPMVRIDGVSRFSRVEYPDMPGVSDCAESTLGSPWRRTQCCLPPRGTTSALWRRLFRSSIPGLPVPLSTLRWMPRGRPRMTRGQDGWLVLSCVTLSFTTPRRFIPAHTTGC